MRFCVRCRAVFQCVFRLFACECDAFLVFPRGCINTANTGSGSIWIVSQLMNSTIYSFLLANKDSVCTLG